MAAKSKDDLDVYIWILEDLIPSCKTEHHFDAIDKIINQFKLLHPTLTTWGLEFIINYRRKKFKTL